MDRKVHFRSLLLFIDTYKILRIEKTNSVIVTFRLTFQERCRLRTRGGGKGVGRN